MDNGLDKNLNQLYSIKGECPEELAQIFSMLRQLINEEFVHKNKLITTQDIYDVLYPKITEYFTAREIEARVSECKKLWNATQPSIVPQGTEPDYTAKTLIKRLEQLEGKEKSKTKDNH